MSKAMYQKIIFSIIIIFFTSSCSKEELVVNTPPKKEKSFETYREAVEAMNLGQYFYASKKFSEAETI